MKRITPIKDRDFDIAGPQVKIGDKMIVLSARRSGKTLMMEKIKAIAEANDVVIVMTQQKKRTPT